MNFGVVLQTNPPAARVIELAAGAETLRLQRTRGRSTPTCCGRSRSSSTAAILAATHKVIVGPMVTNPATRDWTVIASLFATLNEMYGNRTICGIGRGDSAVRVINGKPVNLADLRASIEVIRGAGQRRAVEYKGTTLRFPWNADSRARVWVAAYGPKALRCRRGGRRLHPAARRSGHHGVDASRPCADAAAAAGRDPDAVTICVAAPAYVTDGSDASRAHARDQCRWFGGMVGNHVADIVARYGAEARRCRRR